jgi:hypothetical protein
VVMGFYIEDALLEREGIGSGSYCLVDAAPVKLPPRLRLGFQLTPKPRIVVQAVTRESPFRVVCRLKR